MNKLLEYIDKSKKEVELTLTGALSDKKKNNPINIVLYQDALDKLSRFSTQGKMIRGALVLASYEMFGGKPSDVLPIAAAIELFHSALLIHDDIIDDDVLRRGEPTIFAQYAQGHTKFYGQSMAICVGDIAFFAGIELITKSTIGDSEKTPAIAYFSRELQNVGAAEMEDFHFGATDEEPTIEGIINMYRLKSARYTFSLPLVIGAMVSKQTPETIKLLESFGENLGIVFQIVDDSLGITGDTTFTGKPVGNDIKQNKKTVFRKMLFDAADSDTRTKLESIFGKAEVSENDVREVISIAENLKVNEKVDEMVAKYSNRASEILKILEIPSDFKSIFEELIEYNISRNK